MQIYTPYLAYDHFLEKSFHMNKDGWRYNYVCFVIDETANIEKVVNKINTVHPQNKSRFIQKDYTLTPMYNLKGTGTIDISHQNDYSSLLKMTAVIPIIAVGIYFVSQYMYILRKKKESYILEKYNYHSYLFYILKSLIYLSVVFIIFMAVHNSLFELINTVAKNSLGEVINSLQIITFSPISLLISLFICIMILFIQEGIFYGTHFKNHHKKL